jgi:hypothetical protein
MAHAPGQRCDCILVINDWSVEELNAHPEETERFQTVIPDVNVSCFYHFLEPR